MFVKRAGVVIWVTMLFGIGLALAQNPGVIEERKKLFKAMDVVADDLYDMVEGKKKFDLAFVKKAFETWVEDTKKLQTLFPDDSKTGKTRAAPKVWTDKARFDGLLADFGKDSEAALAAVTNQATFKTAMPKLFGDCKRCHDDFRIKRR